MKTLLFLLTLSSFLLAHDYAVQVIAVKEPKSISQAFMRMAQSLKVEGISVQKRHEGTFEKVVFESFSTKEKAVKFCKNARKNFVEDAFVRKNVATEKNSDLLAMIETNKKVEEITLMHKKSNTIANNSDVYKSKAQLRREEKEAKIANALAFYRTSKHHKFVCDF